VGGGGRRRGLYVRECNNEGSSDEETSPFISVKMLGLPMCCRKHVNHSIEILICLLLVLGSVSSPLCV